MLKQCQKSLRKWEREAELFLGEAERLPFRDAAFDVVFHVGGINFFNDKAQAVREMIRVAKPGTKLIIADETEDLAQSLEHVPVAGKFYGNREEIISAPVAMVPPELQEVNLELLLGGRLYCLEFRKPR